MSATYLINLVTMSCALAISLILLLSVLMGAKADRVTQGWFFAVVLLNVLGLLCEFAVGLLMGRFGTAIGVWLHILDWLSYTFSALMNMAFALYLLAYLQTKGMSLRRAMLPIYICSAASIVMATVSQFTGLYSHFDVGNNYHQGSLFWVALIPPVLSLAALTGVIVRCRSSLNRGELATLLAYTAIPIFCTIIEVLVGSLWLSYFAASITLFLVYLNLQMDFRRRMKEQEMALAESRMAMMISQIQPHFIFNTLSAITRLCENTEAREALTTFAEYLRVNMDSLSRREPVPFQWELEHVKEYLWLERLRFEEKLAVVYDIRAEQFMLPVLTVQPLVENAVRYGVTKRSAGGVVTIRSEETSQGYRVTVMDDGAGFDPQAPFGDGRSHTGIENVRTRLKTLCNGTLRIQSAPEQGTTAIIDIPK